MFNQPSHPVSLINATILWPEFRWVSCSDFCLNVRAVQMSCSFLVHFSFSFYRSCQADYRHVLSRSLARHFYGQNLACVSLRIFVQDSLYCRKSYKYFKRTSPLKINHTNSQGISSKCTSPPTKPVPSGRVVTSWTL